EQQFAFRIEWPGIAALHVVLARQAPEWCRRRLRSSPARPDAEPYAARGASLAIGRTRGSLHPGQRRRNVGIDADRIVGIAAGFHEGAHCVGRLRLAQQDAMHPAAEDLAELPGIVTDMRGIDAV